MYCFYFNVLCFHPTANTARIVGNRAEDRPKKKNHK